MDPVTLALLAAGSLASIGSGVAGAVNNDDEQKRNKEQLATLLQHEKRGTLGLSPDQQTYMTNQLVSPVQRAATQMQTRGEQAQAVSGNNSGAALARLREEQSRTVSGAQQSAAQQLLAAQAQAVAQQKNEIEQRVAQKAAFRQDDWNSILGGIQGAAGPAGALAGAAPGTLTDSGIGGSGGGAGAAAAPTSGGPDRVLPGLSYDETQALARYYKENPGHVPPQLAGVLQPYIGAL